MTHQVPTIELGDGRTIPALGLGTWMLEGRRCEEAVAAALDLGYRHIDTAELYGNEKEIGRAIARFPRERLWITSKASRENLAPDDLRRACERSLRRLGTDYLDLYLIHWPNAGIPVQATVDTFHGLMDDGRIRGWGVSNFTDAHMREIAEFGTPATNQVELHPYFNQRHLADACRELGVPLTAYSPLARGRVNDDDVLAEIGHAHDRSPAQVALRWILQHGHVAIPKSSSAEHLRANIDILDFELDPHEMRRIDARPQGERLVDGSWSEFDRSEAEVK